MVDISGLGAIDEDVPFDYGTADALISAFNGAASEVEGQSGSRSSFVTTALTEFRGVFSELFRSNASVASSDASELVSRLREVATGAGRLAEEARKEQQRRQTAREWKRRQEDRWWGEKAWDGLWGGEDPPVGPPAVEPTIPVSASRHGARETPQPGTSGGGGGTSSAKPADLRAFAAGSAGLNEGLRSRLGVLRGHLTSFASNCRWGTLSADGVMTGYSLWLGANDQDVLWANTVADAFAAAGGEGAVSSLPDSALAQALQVANVSATRQDLTIAPPQAYGHPPTTGYADDPVNTATGNFVETEVDVGFAGASSSLVFSRTYNALTTDSGVLGTGWACIVDQRIEIDDEGATWTLPDGRRVIFPRSGEGWGRAPGENLWLTQDLEGLQVTDNSGGRWLFSMSGQWVSTSRGLGAGVRAIRDDVGVLVRLEHERGRYIDLKWAKDRQRVVSVQASDGRAVEFTYNKSDQLVAVTSVLGTRSYDWNEDGVIYRVSAADGVCEVENSYDDHRRVCSQVSPFGRTTRYAYLPGRTTVVSDLDGGRANTWIADQKGRLVGVVDANDQRQSMSYDEFGNLVSVTGRDGAVTVHAYDERGRRIRTLTPSTADITYGYDTLDRVTTVVAVSGGVTEYQYEGENRNPSVIVDPMGGRTTLSWDGGLVTKVEDPTGVTITYDYDSYGDLVATTNALGHSARLERDEAGRVIAAISPMGARTNFRYNAAGVLVSREDANGAVTRYEHTQAGQVSAIIDPLGARTGLEYGPHGQLVRTVDPLGRVLTRSFDDLGNVASAGLPDGSEWRFGYDGLSRLVSTIDPAGGEWSHRYGVDGNLSTMVDPTGVSTVVDADVATSTVSVSDGGGTLTASTRCDPWGRPVAVRGPGGEDELVTYDVCGRVVELVDAEGGLTVLRRDAAGRVVERVSPTGASTRFEYDVCGRLERVTDPAGGVSVLVYDGDSRLISRTSPTGEVAWVEYGKTGRVSARFTPGHGLARFTHDAVGRVTWSQDSWFGTRKFRYDLAGQLVETVNGNGGVTRFEYDELSRLVRITDPGGGVTTREYNALNKVISVTDPLGRTTTASYDGAGRQISQRDPDGRITEWGFDACGRQQSLSVNGRLLSTIERDIPGHRVVITDNSAPSGGQVEHELAWNRRHQLIRRTRGNQTVSWAYDADGYRTHMTSPNGHTTSYQRDANGRVTVVENEELGQATFTYDGSGRLVEAGAGDIIQHWGHQNGFVTSHQITTPDGGRETLIERDTWGRVVRITDGDRARVFDYDQACQLIEEHVINNSENPGTGGGGVSRWVFDHAGRLVSEVDAGTGQVREHTYDAASQLVTTSVGGQETRFAYNGAGNRTRMAGPDGSTRVYEWAETGWLAKVTARDATETLTSETSLWVDATGELAHINTDEVFWDTARGYAPSLVQTGDTNIITTPGGFTGIDNHWHTPGWRTTRANTTDPWDVDPVASLPSTTTGTDTGVHPGGVGVGGAGELMFAGLEWMGARVYDTGSRGFLSVDPLPPVPGSGWAGNPYAFAGNDPIHALDPAGLSPVTEAELKAYADSNNGVAGVVGGWVADNWEYLAGGAMILAGGIMMATGVGGPAGMMLISAGADTVIQKATTGEVNWGQVAISGAFGAWGGVGAAARLGAKAGVQQVIVGGMISGGASGAVGGGYGYVTGPGPHTPGGFLQATVGGAGVGSVLGGAGSAAGHGAGALGNKLLPKPGPVLDDLTPTPQGIIYERIDLNGEIKPYIGQSKDKINYQIRQDRHTANFPDADFRFRVIDNTEPGLQLDRHEQYWIDQYGGPTNKSNPDGGLSNKRNQMNPQRYEDAGGSPYDP